MSSAEGTGTQVSVETDNVSGDILSPNSVPNTNTEASTVTEVSSETPKTFDEAYVKQLREEAAKHRTEKQREAKEKADLLKRLKEFEDAQLSETERAQKDFEETRTRADKNEARARDLEVKYQLALAASNPANEIGDVRAAIKLLDRDTLEFDGNGKITNLQDALEALKKEYPSVVASKSPSAPNTGVTNPAKAPAAKKYTRADLAGMTPERIAELNEAGELNHLLRGGR